MSAQQRTDVVAQRRTRPTQADLQAPHVGHASFDLARALDHPRTLLTMAQAAVYLCFAGPRAAEKCLHYLQCSHVRLLRRGRLYLVRLGSIDALLDTGKGDTDRLAAEMAAQLPSPAATRSVAQS